MTEPVKVDMHIHLYPEAEIGRIEKEYQIWEYGDRPQVCYSDCLGTVDEIDRAMKEASVSKAVLLIYFRGKVLQEQALSGLPPRLAERELGQETERINAEILSRLESLNRWGCSVSRDNPQISTFVTVDLTVQSPSAAAKHVQEMADQHGAKGVKLHSALQGFSMSDERLWPLYAMCQERGLPVLGHGGPDRDGLGVSDPNAFAPMLKAFPRLTVVLAHMGGAAWRQTAAVAKAHPNLYFDCCEIIEWTGAPLAPSDMELAELIKAVGSERVMMGSDFPWYDFDHSAKRLMELPLLSHTEKSAMLGANALRILGL